LKSPCVNVCVLDPARGTCRGCGRTLDEIARWGGMSDAERDAIMERLARQGIDWYFDFVSPFSHLSLYRLQELPVRVAYKPVLFAGLLNHWGQKGPAEIPAKRQWTYRWCTWWAGELGIPFRFPRAHPFNPLHYLRLSIACGNRPEAVRRIFDFLWTTGEDPADPARFSELCRELKVAEAQLAEPSIKDQLRQNTEEAAGCGVFGVPSFVVDGEVFWGADSIAFLNAFLKDRSVLRNDEMRRVDALPVAASRK
jgi:2-hydroxychromene-2-carboxylate isomerase